MKHITLLYESVRRFLALWFPGTFELLTLYKRPVKYVVSGGTAGVTGLFIFLNRANIGGLNKSVLQAMAGNLDVVTSNEAYRGILPDEQIVAPDAEAFVTSIQSYLQHPIPIMHRSAIIRDHGLPQLVKKIVTHLSSPHA